MRLQFDRGLEVGLLCDETMREASSLERLNSLAESCALGITRHRIPRRPSLHDVYSLSRSRRQWASNPPDIIHGHGAKGTAYSRILARGLRAISVCTPHGGSLHFSYGSIAGATYLSVERMLRGWTGGMIFESDFARREYESKVGSIVFPYRIVRNGLHDSEFTPIQTSNAQYDFVFVGEFRELKGIFTILEAALALKSRHHFKLLMVGSGPDESKIRRRITEYGLSEFVALSPPIHPARSAFALARFVLAPSIRESMPYIVLEALAARCPLLTTAVGGIPEIYGSRDDMLLTPGDSAMLSERMGALLRSPLAAVETAGELHEHAKNHIRVTQMESKIFDFYQEVEQSSLDPSIYRERNAGQ